MPTMGLSHLHVGSNSVSSPGRIRNADCLQLPDQVLCAYFAPDLHATQALLSLTCTVGCVHRSALHRHSSQQVLLAGVRPLFWRRSCATGVDLAVAVAC